MNCLVSPYLCVYGLYNGVRPNAPRRRFPTPVALFFFAHPLPGRPLMRDPGRDERGAARAVVRNARFVYNGAVGRIVWPVHRVSLTITAARHAQSPFQCKIHIKRSDLTCELYKHAPGLFAVMDIDGRRYRITRNMHI